MFFLDWPWFFLVGLSISASKNFRSILRVKGVFAPLEVFHKRI